MKPEIILFFYCVLFLMPCNTMYLGLPVVILNLVSTEGVKIHSVLIIVG